MKKGQGNPSRRTALFGGTGEVLVWDLLGATRIRPFTAALACELEPGGSVGAHVQQEYAEIVIVTEGRGAATVNGVEQPLEPGSVVALPLGKVLSLRNGSADDPLRYLIIKAMAPAEPAPAAPAP